MEMKEIDKMLNYGKIQEKIDKLHERNAKLWDKLGQNENKIDKLKNLQKKYE